MPFFLVFALFRPFSFLISSFLTLNSAHSHAKFRYLSYCGIYFENLRFVLTVKFFGCNFCGNVVKLA